MGIRSLRRAACAAFVLSAVAGAAHAQNTPVTLGMSGWTGFAPLTLAERAGIFKKHGVDVEIKMIPQKDRHRRWPREPSSAPPPRWRRMWRGMPTACRSRRSSSSTSLMVPTARRCGPTSRASPT